jgi:hypothetical protein
MAISHATFSKKGEEFHSLKTNIQKSTTFDASLGKP